MKTTEREERDDDKIGERDVPIQSLDEDGVACCGSGWIRHR